MCPCKVEKIVRGVTPKGMAYERIDNTTYVKAGEFLPIGGAVVFSNLDGGDIVNYDELGLKIKPLEASDQTIVNGEKPEVRYRVTAYPISE